MLSERINDKAFIHLIEKWLKAVDCSKASTVFLFIAKIDEIF